MCYGWSCPLARIDEMPTIKRIKYTKRKIEKRIYYRDVLLLGMFSVLQLTFQNFSKFINIGTYSSVRRPPRPGSRRANNDRHRSNDGPPIVRKPRSDLEKPTQLKLRMIACNCVASISFGYRERSLYSSRCYKWIKWDNHSSMKRDGLNSKSDTYAFHCSVIVELGRQTVHHQIVFVYLPHVRMLIGQYSQQKFTLAMLYRIRHNDKVAGGQRKECSHLAGIL